MTFNSNAWGSVFEDFRPNLLGTKYARSMPTARIHAMHPKIPTIIFKVSHLSRMKNKQCADILKWCFILPFSQCCSLCLRRWYLPKRDDKTFVFMSLQTLVFLLEKITTEVRINSMYHIFSTYHYWYSKMRSNEWPKLFCKYFIWCSSCPVKFALFFFFHELKTFCFDVYSVAINL